MLAPLFLLLALAAPTATLSDELGSTVTLDAICATRCPRGEVSIGAGEIIGSRADGSLVVLTARHVIEGTSRVLVYVRNDAWPGIDLKTLSRFAPAHVANVLAFSRDSDLALVTFRPRRNDRFTVAPLGGESAPAGPGVVVGNPNGSLWIDSAYRFLSRGENTFELECATCGPGDSGGGVFDADGVLQGIVVRQRVNGTEAAPLDRTTRFQAISSQRVQAFLDEARALVTLSMTTLSR